MPTGPLRATGARAADGAVVTRSGRLSQALRKCGEVFWSAKRHVIGKISYVMRNAGSSPAQACDRPPRLLQSTTESIVCRSDPQQ